jgi:hypothetical protein
VLATGLDVALAMSADVMGLLEIAVTIAASAALALASSLFW